MKAPKKTILLLYASFFEKAMSQADVPGKGHWFSRAANKVANVASSMSAKTAAVLDFHSGAADVIVVKHVLAGGEVELRSTGWAVHAGRDNKTTLSEETVDVFVNGRMTNLRLFVGDDHNCFFGGGADRPQSADLEELELRDGPNALSFSVSSAPNTRFTAELWLWPADVALVVCDIDGTITRSDVVGYGAHKLGFDATHSGVCEAFQTIERQGYRTIYLSARPITKAAKTRDMLAQVGQKESGFEMPSGPLITTSERSLQALVRSFRRKGNGADQFKLSALLDIASAFDVGGRSGRSRVFYGGFGNRPSDAQAYSAAGVPANRIFIIDESSRLSLRETREVYASYSELMSSVPRYFPPAKIVLERELQERAVYDDSAPDDFDQSSGTQYVAQTSPSLRATSSREVRSGGMPLGSPVNYLDEQEEVRCGVGLRATEYQRDSSEEELSDRDDNTVASMPSSMHEDASTRHAALNAEQGAGATDTQADDSSSSRAQMIALPARNVDEDGGNTGKDGQGRASGAVAPAPVEEDDDEEDDFDPDVWRRKQKKMLRAQRVADANSRWGFTADGREPSVLGDQCVGGSMGGSVHFRAEVQGGGALTPANAGSTSAPHDAAASAPSDEALPSSECLAESSPACEDGEGELQAAAAPDPMQRGNGAIGEPDSSGEHGGGHQTSKRTLLSLLTKASPAVPEDFSDITIDVSDSAPPHSRVADPERLLPIDSENANGNVPAASSREISRGREGDTPTVGVEHAARNGVEQQTGGGDVLVGLGLTFNKAGHTSDRGLNIKRCVQYLGWCCLRNAAGSKMEAA